MPTAVVIILIGDLHGTAFSCVHARQIEVEIFVARPSRMINSVTITRSRAILRVSTEVLMKSYGQKNHSTVGLAFDLIGANCSGRRAASTSRRLALPIPQQPQVHLGRFLRNGAWLACPAGIVNFGRDGKGVRALVTLCIEIYPRSRYTL